MIRSAFAVLAGYVVMVVIVVIGTMAAVRLILHQPISAMPTPGVGPPSAPYLRANLVVSALAAFLGGWVTAAIATYNPLQHGVALAALMVVMSLVSMRQARGSQPRWYQLVLLTVMPLVCLLGAWLSAGTS